MTLTKIQRIVYSGMFAALMAVGAFIKIMIPAGPFMVTFSLQFFFAFPAIVKRGDLTVSISTNGSSPAYTRMSSLRKVIPSRIPDQETRRRLYKDLIIKLIDSSNKISDEEIESCIKEYE